MRYLTMIPLALMLACNGDKDTTDDTDVTDDTDMTDDTDVMDDTDMTDDTDVVVDPTCAAWCASLSTTCAAEPSYGFPSEEVCNTWCTASGIPAGTAADTSGNTLGCRIYHAGVAATQTGEMKTDHCNHASSFGGGVCGGLVENFCAIEANVCTGDNANTWDPDCATVAGAFSPGTPGDTSGDSLSCRVYHLGVAVLMPDDHCGHVAADGGGVCVSAAR